jgi:hypothetical protein
LRVQAQIFFERSRIQCHLQACRRAAPLARLPHSLACVTVNAVVLAHSALLDFRVRGLLLRNWLGYVTRGGRPGSHRRFGHKETSEARLPRECLFHGKHQ